MTAKEMAAWRRGFAEGLDSVRSALLEEGDGLLTAKDIAASIGKTVLLIRAHSKQCGDPVLTNCLSEKEN